MKAMKHLRGTTWAGLWLLLSLTTFAAASAQDAEPPSDTGEALVELSPSELAAFLMLDIEPSFEDARPCSYFVEVGDYEGYCIDHLSKDQTELRAIAARLQGRELPTEQEEYFNSLVDELNASGDRALLDAILELQQDLRSTDSVD